MDSGYDEVDVFRRAREDAIADIASQKAEPKRFYMFVESYRENFLNKINELFRSLKLEYQDIAQDHDAAMSNLESTSFDKISSEKKEFEVNLQGLRDRCVRAENNLVSAKEKLELFKVSNKLEDRDADITSPQLTVVYIVLSILAEVIFFAIVLKFSSNPLGLMGLLYTALSLGLVLALVSIFVGYVARGVFHVDWVKKLLFLVLLTLSSVVLFFLVMAFFNYRAMEISVETIGSHVDPLIESTRMAFAFDFQPISVDVLPIFTITLMLVVLNVFYLGYKKISDVYPGYSSVSKKHIIAGESYQYSSLDYEELNRCQTDRLLASVDEKLDEEKKSFCLYDIHDRNIVDMKDELSSHRCKFCSDLDRYINYYCKTAGSVYIEPEILKLKEFVGNIKEDYVAITNNLSQSLDDLENKFNPFYSEYKKNMSKLENVGMALKSAIKDVSAHDVYLNGMEK